MCCVLLIILLTAMTNTSTCSHSIQKGNHRMNSHSTKARLDRVEGIIRRVSAVPANAWHYLSGKSSNLLRSIRMARSAPHLDLDSDLVQQVREELATSLRSEPASSPIDQAKLTSGELSLIRTIKAETEHYNLNN